MLDLSQLVIVYVGTLVEMDEQQPKTIVFHVLFSIISNMILLRVHTIEARVECQLSILCNLQIQSSLAITMLPNIPEKSLQLNQNDPFLMWNSVVNLSSFQYLWATLNLTVVEKVRPDEIFETVENQPLTGLADNHLPQEEKRRFEIYVIVKADQVQLIGFQICINSLIGLATLVCFAL
ncbi:hypothetical protein ACE6H2_016191 [Prunus campanulata]